ncbi:uncharacterized protein EV422DRAFT_502847 [Fimicolochytrium jonesii]|uniref:uncharacterized protein n=1 Tax=Fimicolochytrium jonesii TaxID=1396493 RepID=UPI0022FE4084|nr:uncharacterized protein EV422DRAFT_502847 [Fimicolochytrium jonesii]KAI8827143.1 hypothetical protein EV422DRAFT_502847 [Fimicolochytrium jonesii]
MSDNNQNPAFNHKFCLSVLNRIKDSNKDHRSMVSSCNVLSDQLHLVKKPKDLLSSIEKKWSNKHTRANKVKFLSKVLRNMSAKEKRILFDNEKDLSDEMVDKQFNEDILEHFTKMSLSPEEKEKRQKGNDEQKMTELDLENYVPFLDIVGKIKEVLSTLTSENIIKNQMLVALIIFWSSDKMLRGDISTTCFDQNADVYIESDCSKIVVKDANKTGRSHEINLKGNGRKTEAIQQMNGF